MTASDLPPVVLTFLAPAERCNQHCPACYISEVVQEPVTRFERTPEDFARFVEQFLRAGVPILAIAFQGYEVTLRRSWPFVEAVFGVAREHGLRKSFITNGMLLSKWTDRIVALETDGVTVSLDGASAEVNDPIRGLPGAFEATTRTVRRFVERAPAFAPRVSIASTVFDESGFRSLLNMPLVLRGLGVKRWKLTAGMGSVGGGAKPLQEPTVFLDRFRQLHYAAEAEGVECAVNDELDLFRGLSTAPLRIGVLPNPEFVYRMDPLGYVRSGRDVQTVWDPQRARRWDPNRDDAVEVSGYWSTTAAARASTHSWEYR